MGPLTQRDRQRTVSDGDLLELRSALALAGVRGLGPAHARLIIDRAGSATAAVAAVRRGELLTFPECAEGPLRPIGPVLTRRLRDLHLPPAHRIEALARNDIRLISYRGPEYPSRLEHLFAPPIVLYLTGPRDMGSRRCVSIVGTRTATRYGREIARSIASGLATAGCMVVSGMAKGIDGQAHRGALDVRGRTAGVLGSGFNYEYPRENADLYRSMRRTGLLVSEFAPAVRPSPGLFPRRNRIIAALGTALVVVQAGHRSGAQNTVNHALEIGREVFAVPGPVGPEASAGVNQMLQDGAGLATSADDVLAALGWAEPVCAGVDGRPGPESPARARAGDDSPAVYGPGASADDAPVLEVLRDGPADADRLASRVGLGVASILARLGRLELDGVVRGLPGGRYELRTPLERVRPGEGSGR